MTDTSPEALLKAAALYKHAREGSRKAQFQVSESISQGDFPTQIAPLVRRTLVAAYQAQPKVLDRWTTRETVQSIGVDEQYNVFQMAQDNIPGASMGKTFLPGTLPRIANREKYPQLNLKASGKTLRAEQFGEAFGIDWQAIVNLRGSNIDLIDQAVQAFALHASQVEDSDPVYNLMLTSGINTTALNASGAQVLTGNPKAASILDIQAAVRLAQTTKIDGVPAYFDKFALLTAPANVPVFKQILTSTTITSVPLNGTTGTVPRGTQYQQSIDLGASIDVVPQQWLTAINPTLTSAWFLVPVGGPRPVITANYLAGYETPGFWVKDGNAKNYNGGDVPFLDGDFDSDAIQTKVRHVFGTNLLWGNGIVYSDGTGASLTTL